ncbi:hypothetical protein N431DRAFT_352019, partial [Stipitochalara longipes BDJ]
VKVKFVPFVLEGQNIPKYFPPHETPSLLSRLLKPRRTSLGWTVDCFVARFGRFEKLFNDGYERWPNPIAWLEAEMDREDVLGQQIRPWKLVVENGEKEPKEPPVIDWETLQSLQWLTRGDYSKYPKSTFSPGKRGTQPLELHDIISPNSFRFRESTRAKKGRKEKEKAAKKSTVIDLTGNSSGHMNQTAVRRGFNEIHSGYTGDESELTSPMPRKRKHTDNSRPQFTRQVGTDEETLPTSDRLQNSRHIKQERATNFVRDDDLYGISDREEERRIQRQSKRIRYQSSPPKRSQSPNSSGIVMAPRSIKEEDYQLRTRASSNDATIITSIFESGQTSSDLGDRRKHIYSTSSPESDSDIELIETSSRHLPSALKSQSKSPTKASTSSGFLGSKHNFGIQERLNAFEHQFKIPQNEFDSRYYERLHSPSFSPEAQQNLCPSTEFSPSFGSNTPPSSNKSTGTMDRMVIDLESPEPDYQDGDAERGAHIRPSMSSSEKIQGCIDMTDDLETVSSDTLSSRTISRSAGSLDEIQSRIASFRVAGDVVRRNSL